MFPGPSLMLRRFVSLQPRMLARAKSSKAQDWSPDQYLRFMDQRNRPALDLLAKVPLTDPGFVVDLGCGPGNSSYLLHERFPASRVHGIDTSPAMIRDAKASSSRPNDHFSFSVADLRTYTPEAPADLLFSNAAMHWIPRDERLPLVRRLIQGQPKGGVFAMQVPDNHAEPVHVAMRQVAGEGPWAETLARHDPSIGPFQAPTELYDELKPLCDSVDVWHTVYNHPMTGHGDIVEWMKGAGMRPYLEPLNGEEREQFLARYLEVIREMIPAMRDGGVMLRYPRLFMVAVRS